MKNRQHVSGSTHYAHLSLPQCCLQLVDAAVLPLGMRDGLAYVLLQAGNAVLLLLQGRLCVHATCVDQNSFRP